MGIFDSLVGGLTGGLGSALAGGVLGALTGGNKQSGSQTVTTQQQLDPRAQAILYGDGTSANPGLLAQYQQMLGKPQNAGASQYGTTLDQYLGAYGNRDTNTISNVGQFLAGGASVKPVTGTASVVSGQPYTAGAQIKGPTQNNLDLSSSYDKFINGNPAENPYLTGAIAKGINQSQNAFNQMQQTATDNLQKNILPGIRSNAVASGLYGSSRQGIAEGNALGDFAKAQQQAISQFGQNNTDAAVAAQAGAFSQGQDRALAATQGLGAQQYGQAQQQANFAQQAALAAQQLEAARNSQNSAQQQQVFNNDTATMNNAQQLNNQNALAGAGLLSGLNGNAYNTSNSQGNYGLNQAQQVNGLLAPYLSLGGSTTQSQPLYTNTGANVLGGAAAGLGLFNQFKRPSSLPSNSTYAANDWFTS